MRTRAAVPRAGVADLGPSSATQSALEPWCRQRLEEGAARRDAGDLEAAIEAFQRGYERCGNGFGFLREIGSAYWLKDLPEEAADYYQREVSAPNPSEEAFFGLAKMFMRVQPEHRSRIAAMGAVPSQPIHVPAINFEYRWVNTFACEGDRVTVVGQSVVSVKNGPTLDRIEFQCARQPGRVAYFNSGDDLRGKALH